MQPTLLNVIRCTYIRRFSYCKSLRPRNIETSKTQERYVMFEASVPDKNKIYCRIYISYHEIFANAYLQRLSIPYYPDPEGEFHHERGECPSIYII